MLKKLGSLTPLFVVLGLMAGCASPTATVGDPYDTGAVVEEELPIDEAIGPDEGDPESLPSAAVSPTAEPTVAPTPTPTPAPPALEATVTSIDTSGALWWKKVTVSGEVRNLSTGPLSGMLAVTFTKAGSVVQTRGRSISNLAAGDTLTFSYTSDKSADDAEIAITTD